jgi:hypothetical protein
MDVMSRSLCYGLLLSIAAGVVLPGCKAQQGIQDLSVTTSVSWSPLGTTSSPAVTAGDNYRILDFEVTPQMTQGLPDNRLAVTVHAGSASLVNCQTLSSLPDYTTPFALLLSIDRDKMREMDIHSIGAYLRQKRQTDAYKILDIAYYLPILDTQTGEIGKLCQHDRAAAFKRTTQLLAPGWYRIVLSSSLGFPSKVFFVCIPVDATHFMTVEASDFQDMEWAYKNRQH